MPVHSDLPAVAGSGDQRRCPLVGPGPARRLRSGDGARLRSPLAVLVGTVALLETLLLSALAPLLPLFEEDLGLSKAEVGVLNAAYPFGTMVVALPAAYLAARIGCARRSALGLVLLAARRSRSG